MARREALFISASRSDSVVILMQPGKGDGSEVIGLAGQLQQAISQLLPEISVSVGIGRPHRSLIDLRQSYYEASYAIKIRKLKGGDGVIASFDDLGSYGLLLGLQDTLSLEVFYDSVLGRLQEYDEQNSSDLVKSLACFLEANGHWGDAAEKLYVHRHTLRYRMKRVEEITGRDLDQSQDRMEFWLALKAKELIDQSKQGQAGRPVERRRASAARRPRFAPLRTGCARPSRREQRPVVDDDVDASHARRLQAEPDGGPHGLRPHQPLPLTPRGGAQRRRAVLVVVQVHRARRDAADAHAVRRPRPGQAA